MASASVVHLTLRKENDARLGMTVVTYEEIPRSGTQVVIALVAQGGLIDDWNRRNPAEAVSAGDVVLEANGCKSGAAIMDELTKLGTLELVVRLGGGFKIDLPDVDVEGHPRTAIARCSISKGENVTTMRLLPVVPVGGAGVDMCAICLECVGAMESIALPACGHGFHQACLARWIHQSAKRTCPLCVCDLRGTSGSEASSK